MGWVNVSMRAHQEGFSLALISYYLLFLFLFFQWHVLLLRHILPPPSYSCGTGFFMARTYSCKYRTWKRGYASLTFGICLDVPMDWCRDLLYRCSQISHVSSEVDTLKVSLTIGLTHLIRPGLIRPHWIRPYLNVIFNSAINSGPLLVRCYLVHK